MVDVVYFRLIVGHENHAFEAESIANVSETDAGVAGRAFDNSRA
jgi:hypothetical protein